MVVEIHGSMYETSPCVPKGAESIDKKSDSNQSKPYRYCETTPCSLHIIFNVSERVTKKYDKYLTLQILHLIMLQSLQLQLKDNEL